MKIAQVCGTYRPWVGGVPTHVEELSKRLVANGIDVEVLTTDPSGQLPVQQMLQGVSVMRFRSWAPDNAYCFSEGLRKYLARSSSSYDIVHAHSYHALPALYAAISKGRNAFVFTPHYFGAAYSLFRRLVHIPYRVVARRIFEKADSIIVTSEYERSLVNRDFSLEMENVSIIPNGVCIEDFRRLDKHGAKRTILYAGRLFEQKGVQVLIKALPHLDSDISLDIVGSGPYHGHLLRLSEKLRVKDRVTFHGALSREHMPFMYARAGLFVLLSQYETYGISVAEALAAGTPCIVANTSALSEWVDGKNCFGIKYPVRVEELVELVRRVIGRTVTNARVPDWDDVADRLIEEYDSIKGTVRARA